MIDYGLLIKHHSCMKVVVKAEWVALVLSRYFQKLVNTVSQIATDTHTDAIADHSCPDFRCALRNIKCLDK